MVNYLKHIYHRWVGLPDSILIDVSVLFCLTCSLGKIGSLGSFLRLAYLIEMSNFVALLALCILGCTFLAWLVLWLPHLIYFPSIPGGFLDGWLLFEEVYTSELFCPTFFPLVCFDLLLFPLFCLWSYVAKFTEELELSWDRNLC